VNGDGGASRLTSSGCSPADAASVSAAATVFIDPVRVNALISRRSASYVPPRRIGGAGRNAMLLGAVSRDELCQIVLHQGLNEPAGKLEKRAPIE
jgi:hypothetical protein